MNAVKAMWTNGRIVPGEPVDWPDGSELVVEPVAMNGEKVGLDESEWRDNPTELAEWDSWLCTIEQRVLTDDERAAFAAYEQKARLHNLEAVRRQMAAEDGR